MALRSWPWVGWGCRLILGGIFIYASVDKIAHPAQFAQIIFNYKILPPDLVNLAALILPWVEMIAGGLLVLGVFVVPSISILTFLVVIFLAAIGYNLGRGLNFQCGCFSTDPEAMNAGVQMLIRDAGLLVLAMLCLVSTLRRARRWPSGKERNGL